MSCGDPAAGPLGAGGPLAGLRIGLITASASRLGGGVFEAVAAHAAMLTELGAEPSIFALDDPYAQIDRARFAGVPVSTHRIIGPRQVGFAPSLDRALRAAALDCLHLHGIWMYPSSAAGRWARRTGRGYVISPHGMLDPWITARGRLKKAAARLAYERSGWAAATAFHALTPREAADIARKSGRADSIVIPNPGPPPQPGPRLVPPGRTVVYLGRLHPKKNLLALIAGWATQPRPSDARLLIAGWGDDEYVRQVTQACTAAGPSVELLGPIYGPDKAAFLGRARFVILPSHSEGLPMAMLEAWALGIPTVMTAECNLPEGFAAGAAIECGYDAAALGAVLAQALMADDEQWLVMSQAARALAQRSFSPEVVANRWAVAYRTVTTERPHR